MRAVTVVPLDLSGHRDGQRGRMLWAMGMYQFKQCRETLSDLLHLDKQQPSSQTDPNTYTNAEPDDAILVSSVPR